MAQQKSPVVHIKEHSRGECKQVEERRVVSDKFCGMKDTGVCRCSGKQKKFAILVLCLGLLGQQLEQHWLRHTAHSVDYGTLNQLVA